jgi:glucose-1-phosphate adenylyltransferase
MRNVIGVINLGNTRTLLNELTQNRSIASVPFGGRYRFIDFALSNMVNAGIQKVAVFTLNKSRSLLDHLGSGREWDLDRKQGGLFLLPPAIQYPSGEYKGDLQNFFGHIDYFLRSKENTVIVSSAHMISNIHYEEALKAHEESGAQVTLLYKEVDMEAEELATCVRLEVDADGSVTKMEPCAQGSLGLKMYMETYIIDKALLVELIREQVEKDDYSSLNMIMNNVERLKVKAFEHKGHLAVINCLASYYKHSLELLNPYVNQELFMQPERPIYTKIKDEPPTKYVEESEVSNSLIANGCVIEGQVINSILFRGVKVRKGAVVKDCIIMQDCEIAEGSILENVIFDKEVVTTPGKRLIGSKTAVPVITKRSVM